MRQIILAINALLKFKSIHPYQCIGTGVQFGLRTHRSPIYPPKKIQ